jgi:hypothetical protein
MHVSELECGKINMNVVITTTTKSIETTENWFTHIPKLVCEHEDVTGLWNQEVHTDREVMANRPNIIIKNRNEEPCILINVAILADRNVIQKGAEKKLKYKSLCIEIQ